MGLRLKTLSGAVFAAAPALFCAGCSLSSSPPPLAADLQSLCLKSHLQPAAFLSLAAKAKGLSKTSSNPAPPTGDIAATWTHRLAADHTLLVAFSYRLPSGSIKARSSCFLSDLQDGQKSIDWLSRWTGAKIPKQTFATYYLGLDAGRPKLFPVPGASSPPPTTAAGDLYALHVESFGQATEISLGVSDAWKSRGMAATSSPRGPGRSAPA